MDNVYDVDKQEYFCNGYESKGGLRKYPQLMKSFFFFFFFFDLGAKDHHFYTLGMRGEFPTPPSHSSPSSSRSRPIGETAPSLSP